MLSASLRTTPVESGDGISLLKSTNDLVIAGYASVELVDKQGDLITRGALKHAFDDFMKAETFRNVQLAHSNIQVGEVVPNYTDNDGRVWKSTVDDAGMFVVIRLRDDIEKAREVANEVRKGNLRGFSIGGQAFKRINKHDAKHGDYTEISKLELHEVTICEKGINPEATFRILKEDTNMSETDALNELSAVLDRLNKQMDAMEKGEDKDLPAFMKPNDDDDDDDNGDSKKDKVECADDDDNGNDDDDDEDDDKMKKNNSDYSDVISSEYLNWMENTLKSAGVDTMGAREHFDGIEKANLGSTPEEMDANNQQRTGQTKNRQQEGGNPSTGAVGKVGGKVSKADFLNPNNISSTDVEAAYEVYKASATEQQFKSSLNNVFSDRLTKEQSAERESRAAASFDARGPLGEIQKAVASLGDRIESLSVPVETGTPLIKSNNMATIEIPTSKEMGELEWDQVHELANSVWR
jgi:HK97 family phage prohead protease